VATRAQWDVLASRLRETAYPFEQPELAELWALACEEAPRVLSSFRRSKRLDDERIADLTGDLLLNDLASIIDATNPQAFFVTCLTNAARSWLRRGDARVAAPGVVGGSREASQSATAAPDHALRIDVADFMETLSQRERDVLIGVGNDVDRQVLARLLGTSRANVDQIVSRARKRFPPEEP
jgi:DNA-directed RNA polymerase specialized sigma24 family protein